jgi:hypothetical protein
VVHPRRHRLARRQTAEESTLQQVLLAGAPRGDCRVHPSGSSVVSEQSLQRVERRVKRGSRRARDPLGKDPAEVAETPGYLETVEPLLPEAVTLEIVTTVPVGQVADIVVAHCL